MVAEVVPEELPGLLTFIAMVPRVQVILED
jgi:hypothetical protein